MRFIRKTNYYQDIQIFKHEGQVFWYTCLLLILFSFPFLLSNFYLGELALIFIYAIAGIGLMLLTGYTGLVSLGHAAFLGVGAYTHAYFLSLGIPFVFSLSISVLFSSLIGTLLAIPALRVTGIYLAVATLAFSIIVEQILSHWVSVTGGYRGMFVPDPSIGNLSLKSHTAFYFICLAFLSSSLLIALNILRSPLGRAMTAVRDSEISAQSMGINLARTKTIAFAISAGFTGLAGGLLAHKIGYLAPDSFNLLISIQLLLMVVVGGLGSLHGAIYGAIFIGFLPQALALLRDNLPEKFAQIPGLEPGIFGLILVVVLIYEPLGIYGRWLKVRSFFEEFPLYRRSTHKRQRAFLKTERLR
ncbi:MAG: branched-chain amino acid ABC transporter permease [Candidatus Azotimanducaceae bacterium]